MTQAQRIRVKLTCPVFGDVPNLPVSSLRVLYFHADHATPVAVVCCPLCQAEHIRRIPLAAADRLRDAGADTDWPITPDYVPANF